MCKTKHLKVDLVSVVLDGDYQYEQEISLGLLSIASFLRSKDYGITVHQCLASKQDKHYDRVVNSGADVYGFQLNTVNFSAVQEVVAKIKLSQPNAITVFGGPFLASLADEILRNEALFDFVIVGEGELTMLELLQSIEEKKEDFSTIAGLVWRDASGTIIKNDLRQVIEDLDSLPFPARDFLENAQTDPSDGGLIESVRMCTSRGCVGQCSFCCVNLHNQMQRGKVWRGRSARNVVDELEYLSKEYNVKLVNFSDSSFEDPGPQGKIRSRQICEEIIKRKLPLSAKIYMRCESVKSEQDIELLKLYKKAGIDVIIVGAESGSEYELKLYEKHANLEDNYRMVKILRDLDLFYVITGFIMFGPNSTPETLRSNIEFLYKNDFTDNLNLVSNVLMLIPGSKIYQMLKKEGRVSEPENYWMLPRYTFLNSIAEKMARHWQNIFARFPVTCQVNLIQLQIGNLISRMTNPLNEKVLQLLEDDFRAFKDQYAQESKKIGMLHYNYFLETLELIEQGATEQQLQVSAEEFFGENYIELLPIWDRLYNEFVDKISATQMGLSGLVFRPFYSAMVVDGVERI